MDFRSKQQRFRRPEFQEKLALARRYHRKSEPLETRFGARLVRVLILLSVIAIVYFLVISQIFVVRNVTLTPDSQGPSGEEISRLLKELKKTKFYSVPQNHILFLSQKDLLPILQKQHPEVREITYLKKVFPNRMILSLAVRKPSYIWQTGENYYLLDQDRMVFQKITRYDPVVYPEILITDSASVNVVVGQELEIDKILKFVEKLKEIWPALISKTNFVGFAVPAPQSLDIIAKTAYGFQVYFDLERSAKVQLLHLKMLLDEEIRPETYAGLSYIDLRLPTVAYYCYKDAPCAEQNKK
jgi:cell division septal protein FtsQ